MNANKKRLEKIKRIKTAARASIKTKPLKNNHTETLKAIQELQGKINTVNKDTNKYTFHNNPVEVNNKMLDGILENENSISHSNGNSNDDNNDYDNESFYSMSSSSSENKRK
jgi:hypothetical protein